MSIHSTPLRQHLTVALQDWWSQVNPLPEWPWVRARQAEERERNAFDLGRDYERGQQRRRDDFGCPSWCRRTDHNADEVGPDSPPIHYGPEFGRVSVQAAGLEDPYICVNIGDDVLALSRRDADTLSRSLRKAVAWG